MTEEHKYLSLLSDLRNAPIRPNRTGTPARSLFGRELRFDLLGHGFPLITTKRVYWHAVVHELAWMLSGETNVKRLKERNVRIWNEWADDDGELGPVYGAQWRGLGSCGVDQIAALLHGLKTNPHSRRHIVSAWNVADLENMALPPCHAFFQCYVDSERRLSLKLTQRSADIFLGVPFNIASYALLVHLLAKECDLLPGELIMSFGDVHLYTNHEDQAALQLRRGVRDSPKIDTDALPRTLEGFVESPDSAKRALVGYAAHPSIRAEVAV